MKKQTFYDVINRLSSTPNNKHQPLFIKTKVLVNYQLMTILLIIFSIGYWCPLLIASNFNPLDTKYKILLNTTFYFFPILFYLAVFIFKSSLKGIYNLMPEIELMAEPEETAKESESFASLFKSKNYKAFIDRFYYWAYSKIEYLIILLFLILDIIATYGYWWVPFHLVYEGTTTVNLYTSISAAVFLIMTLIMIPIIISGFWYLFVFLILISNMQLLKHKIGVRLLDFLRLKKPSTTQDESSLELSDLFNIYIYNKNESKNKSPDSTNQNSRELSYSMFYLRFKSIGNVVMAITLKFLLGVTILAFVIGIDQLFNYKKPDYYSIAFIVVFALFIYLLFISVQGGLFVILRNLKMQSLKNLEKVYFDKQKEFYKIINAGESSQEDKEKLEKIQIVLGLLDNVIEKEKNTPVWLINVPTFVSLLGAVIPTAIGLGIQFLGIL